MDPPDLTNNNDSSPTNAQLAVFLSDAYRDIESLRRDLAISRKRAERAERQLIALGSDSTGSPSAHHNGNPQDQQQKTLKLIEEYEDRISQAEMARDEAEARRRVVQESWEQLEAYLTLVESRAKDARMAFTRISDGSVASLPLLPAPPISGSLSIHSSSQLMARPNIPTRQQSRSQRHFLALPSHPIQNLSPSTGARRPRTLGLDGMYNAAQPPSKRSRANTDDQRRDLD